MVSEYFQSSKIFQGTTNWEFTKYLAQTSESSVAILKDCSHCVFTDLALLMPLEFYLLTLTPSLEQLFRSSYNLNLTGQLIKLFILQNNIVQNPLLIPQSDLKKGSVSPREILTTTETLK